MDEVYFRGLRQGCVLELQGEEGLDGQFVIVSQTCDVVQPKRELIQISPLVQLEDVNARRGALKRENPRYPLVSREEDCKFADLAQMFSVEKKSVQSVREVKTLSIAEGCAAREFGLAVGRWFGRFAMPDEVQPWLAPVQELIRSKYDKPTSALGKVLHEVTEVRVEAVSWEHGPFELVLHVIVRAGAVPSLHEDDSFPDLSNFPSDLNVICEQITCEKDRVRLSMLWTLFAEKLAERCKPKQKFDDDPQVRDAVISVTGELSSDDEFSLAKMRRSEQLDIDFLSDPVPY